MCWVYHARISVNKLTTQKFFPVSPVTSVAETPICDYEGSPWRSEFWPGREYEDRAERIALAHLLLQGVCQAASLERLLRCAF